jgi:hypothetical protein
MSLNSPPPFVLEAVGGDLGLELLFGGAQPFVETRVLEGDGDAAREGFEESEVVLGEIRPVAVVHDLDDADVADAGFQRGGQHLPCGQAAAPVDAVIETRVGGRVVDDEGFTRTQGLSRDAAIGGKPERHQAPGEFQVVGGDVREIELGARRIQEQDRGAFGVEGRAALLDDQRDEVLKVGPFGEGAPEFVQEAKARVFEVSGHGWFTGGFAAFTISFSVPKTSCQGRWHRGRC